MSKAERSESKRRARQHLLLIVVVLAVVAAVAAALYRFVFVPWRANDLARKSVASLDAGNFRMAWVQLASARQMRAEHPSVLRAAAILEGKLGRKEALDLWEEVAMRAALSNDDRAERAVAAMLHGSEEQFAAAIRELEETGDKTKAWALRIGRFTFRGDLDGAIDEGRRALADTNDPGLKLGFARLLLRRHAATEWGARTPEGIAAFEEMAGLVDQLQGTTEAQPALAFGLDNLQAPPEFTRRWIDAALADPVPDNPALLPAAEAAVQSGFMTPLQVHEKLRAAYDAAPLERRAAYSLWLSGHGLTKQALSMVTRLEATKDPVALTAWSDAFAREGRWKTIIEIVDAATGPPESVRAMVRARAEVATGGAAKAENSIRLGLQAAAREGRLPAALGMADKLSGGAKLANEELLALCSYPGLADLTFRLLHARLGYTQGTAALLPAYERARAAAPEAASVANFGRYLALFGETEVDPAMTTETAAAVAAEPSYISPRVTHALLLLKLGQPAQADAVFDDITVFFEQLPPSHQAVVAAVAAANGRKAEAEAMTARIDKSKLTTGEKDLLSKIQPSLGL
jgi:hypothetical protein